MSNNGDTSCSARLLTKSVAFATSQSEGVTSAFDPKRTLLRYRVDTVRWGAVVEHSHEHVARF
jgi:hypothetical protein